MSQQQKLEKVLDLLLSEDQDQAGELLHQIIVEKARSIYESIVDEEQVEDEEKDELDESDEVGGEPSEDFTDEIATDKDEVDADEQNDGEAGSEDDDTESDDDGDDTDNAFGHIFCHDVCKHLKIRDKHLKSEAHSSQRKPASHPQFKLATSMSSSQIFKFPTLSLRLGCSWVATAGPSSPEEISTKPRRTAPKRTNSLSLSNNR